jgi:co-chaperonin GroES (HSP10)
MKAIGNAVIVKRKPPEKYDGSSFYIPQRYAKRNNLNRWVEVVEVGPSVLEDVRSGDMALIGDNTGRPFSLDGGDYLMIYGTSKEAGIAGYGTEIFAIDRQ